MTLAKLINEEITSVAIQGSTILYLGTASGNVYSYVLSSGVLTLVAHTDGYVAALSLSLTQTILHIILRGGEYATVAITPLTAITSTGTTEIERIDATLSAASGILRGIVVNANYSGTQSGTVNDYAIRGYAKILVGGAFKNGNAYLAGIQGCTEIAGTIEGGRLTSVLAQMKVSTGTLTAGELFGLWVDNQMTSIGSMTVHGIGIENTVDSVTLSDMLYVYGRATYLLTIGGPTTTYLKTSGTAGTAAGQLSINTPAGPRYIQLYSVSA